MPKLTTEEQRALGTELARIVSPLPDDERLLAFLAGFYGECRAQSISASGAIELATRVIQTHEAGQLVRLAPNKGLCPSCRRVLP
jgi:hypothetical protein